MNGVNVIPEKINLMNVYHEGNKLIGLSGEITLPNFEAMTETISGPGILGEIGSPTPGHFGSQEIEIPFRVMDEDIFSLMSPLDPVGLTLRASQQFLSSTQGIQYKGLRVVVQGVFKSFTGGTLKQASPMGSSLKLELTYILIEMDGKSRIELDKINGIYKVNAVDVLEKARSLC